MKRLFIVLGLVLVCSPFAAADLLEGLVLYMPLDEGAGNKTEDFSVQFTESVIRGMTQLCIRHNAINLFQYAPAYQPPPEVKASAIEAIQEGYNQYSIRWGVPAFREAIAEKRFLP